MHPLLMAIAATLGVSALSLCGVALMAFGGQRRRSLIFVMVAFAAGAMMATSFFHLMPEAVEELGHFRAAVAAMSGLLFFFILERFLHWRHCHHGECEVHPYTTLSLVGDTLHNFLDGLVIGAAFLVSPGLGLGATAVIAAHELPQELGDFAVLIHGGYSKRRALALNLLTGLAAVLGAVVAYIGMAGHRDWIPYVMGFAAGNFIYISAADLIPELHRERDHKKAIAAIFFFVLAVVIMAAFAASDAIHPPH